MYTDIFENGLHIYLPVSVLDLGLANFVRNRYLTALLLTYLLTYCMVQSPS